MNFRGHVIGGVLAGVVVASAASHWGYIGPRDHITWAAVCCTTVFFSLFPDLDTSSVPQRWFFRLVFVGLVYLGWQERYELATLLGVLSILPLLDHHRGWTHWKISPLVVPVLLGAVYEYWHSRHAWGAGFSWTEVGKVLEEHVVFFAACIIGWYTHLFLDGRFKVFPTDRDHH
jgi:membrane-bound metal-dependent hydrolase YbcI (DUF457 family)